MPNEAEDTFRQQQRELEKAAQVLNKNALWKGSSFRRRPAALPGKRKHFYGPDDLRIDIFGSLPSRIRRMLLACRTQTRTDMTADNAKASPEPKVHNQTGPRNAAPSDATEECRVSSARHSHAAQAAAPAARDKPTITPR